MPSTIKPGDRVRVSTRGGNPAYHGQEGTVDSVGFANALVHFDNEGDRIDESNRIFNGTWTLHLLDLIEEHDDTVVAGLNVGDRVRHRSRGVGDGVVVDPVEGQNVEGHEIPVRWDDHGRVIGAFPENLTLIEAAPTETAVGIRFYGQPARDLATRAGNFRMLAAEHKDTMIRLANGDAVTLDEARAATFDAMRCATTANGQSMGRRRDAYLIQRLWAAIDAATPSPAPVINREAEKLRADLAEQREVSALHESTATDALAEAQRLAESLIQSDQQAETLEHELARANERVEEFRARNDRLLGLNKYIRAMLTPMQEARSLGFADALNGKTEPTHD